MGVVSGDAMSWEDLSPLELASLVSSGSLNNVDLTFAAEHLGVICRDSTLVRRVLCPLLRHADALIREGALYGLNGHLDEKTRKVIDVMASNDPSKGVRQAAADLVTP